MTSLILILEPSPPGNIIYQDILKGRCIRIFNPVPTVLDSFVTRTPSAYSILTLEQTTITYLNYSDLEELCNRYHTMETFYRKLLSMAAVNMMERIGGTLEEKAQVAYHTFVKEHGKLLQRISLADLASYLGITQVSLSRIRSLK